MDCSCCSDPLTSENIVLLECTGLVCKTCLPECQKCGICPHCNGKLEVASIVLLETEEKQLQVLKKRFEDYVTILEKRRKVFLPFPSMEFEVKAIDIQLEHYRDVCEELQKDLLLLNKISEYPNLSVAVLKLIQKKIVRFEGMRNGNFEIPYDVKVEMNHFQGNPKRHILTFVPKDGEKGYFMVHHGGIGVISGVHSYSFDTASLTPFPVFVNYEFLADVDLSKLPSEQMRYDAETKTWIPNHSWNDFAFGFSDEEGRWEIMYGREERHEE